MRPWLGRMGGACTCQNARAGQDKTQRIPPGAIRQSWKRRCRRPWPGITDTCLDALTGKEHRPEKSHLECLGSPENHVAGVLGPGSLTFVWMH